MQGPDFSTSFIIHTEGSDVGISLVLSQMAYSSWELKSRERNYTATEKKCLPLQEGVRHISAYITGGTVHHRDGPPLPLQPTHNERYGRMTIPLGSPPSAPPMRYNAVWIVTT